MVQPYRLTCVQCTQIDRKLPFNEKIHQLEIKQFQNNSLLWKEIMIKNKK